jgi:N,N'-diacetyllegionaminate synthase
MKIEIIAEIAQGFEGSPEQAHLLLRAAAAAGADAAKYQLVFADEIATPDYKYYKLFRSLEMSEEVWESVAKKASGLGINLHFDIFGTQSLQLAERIGAKAIKLHGTDLGNVGLLRDVAFTNIQSILLGAGGGHASEIHEALKILKEKEVVVILGFQGYPTPNGDNQMERIGLLKKELRKYHSNVTIGFADHAPPDSMLSYALAATAIGKGANVIEKHLTLSKEMKLEDFESALNPDEFAEFSKMIRDCASAIGECKNIDDFGMSDSEKNYRKVIRRHVVASQNLIKGARIEPTDVVLKRTSSENVVTEISEVYQKILKRNILLNEPIFNNDFE